MIAIQQRAEREVFCLNRTHGLREMLAYRGGFGNDEG